ncbi:hexose kinase [Rhodobacteraceae bacterium MCCB 386]|nr:hexose kinase [Roseitranquillus sediminis]
MNPALDVSAEAMSVVPNRKVRCLDQRLDPGGGGINVARAIGRLGGDATAFVALAGATGDLVAELLRAERVDVADFRIAGLTRQSFAVTARDTSDQYRFVLAGPEWGPADVDALLAALSTRIEPEMLVVLSGSLPPGLPTAVQGRIKALSRERGACLLLDTSGPALLAAARVLEGGPYHVLRMDGEEAEELSGRVFPSERELVLFGQELVRSGVADHLVMALGARGTAGVTADDAFFCRPPLVETVSAVGAGDSLMGALTLALARGQTFRQAVTAGTAAAAAAVMTPATELCDGPTAERLVSEVRLADVA